MENLDSGVAIVGAGYAGMAAAVTLAERGIPVTVFESGPVPGGRARRVVSQGRELDNGQHIFVGAYTEFLRLLRVVGVPPTALLRLPLELRYTNGVVFRGLLRARRVPFRERVRAFAFMAAMRRFGWRLVRDITVRELLERFEQRGAMLRYVWTHFAYRRSTRRSSTLRRTCSWPCCATRSAALLALRTCSFHGWIFHVFFPSPRPSSCVRRAARFSAGKRCASSPP